MGAICAIKCVKSGLNPASAAFSSFCVGVQPTHLLYSKPQRHYLLQCTVQPTHHRGTPYCSVHVTQATSCIQNHTHCIIQGTLRIAHTNQCAPTNDKFKSTPLQADCSGCMKTVILVKWRIRITQWPGHHILLLLA